MFKTLRKLSSALSKLGFIKEAEEIKSIAIRIDWEGHTPTPSVSEIELPPDDSSEEIPPLSEEYFQTSEHVPYGAQVTEEVPSPKWDTELPDSEKPGHIEADEVYKAIKDGVADPKELQQNNLFHLLFKLLYDAFARGEFKQENIKDIASKVPFYSEVDNEFSSSNKAPISAAALKQMLLTTGAFIYQFVNMTNIHDKSLKDVEKGFGEEFEYPAGGMWDLDTLDEKKKNFYLERIESLTLAMQAVLDNYRDLVEDKEEGFYSMQPQLSDEERRRRGMY
jgi:hypothetical protein